MSADLFSPADVPFNLAGESQSNELTEEGKARAKAEAEAIQKKAQQGFNFVDVRPRDDNGRFKPKQMER